MRKQGKVKKATTKQIGQLVQAGHFLLLTMSLRVYFGGELDLCVYRTMDEGIVLCPSKEGDRGLREVH